MLNLRLYELLIGNQWEPTNSFVNAYVPLIDTTKIVKGDLLLVYGVPNEVNGPANPGEFNYKNYLVYNRIHHQDYLGEDFVIIGHKPSSLIVRISDRLRTYCAENIETYISDSDARAVILALSLGVKDELDNELVQAFSATGVMHVLAVSGLHVGIIYLLLFNVFRKLGLTKKRYRWLMAILSILLLWFYALLTGLSPSVLRAVTMFTFVALRRALFRKGNIYNTLAASAFVLLWFNPYLIMSVGFQLSYLAVFGIVYLQPKLYALWSTDVWILDRIWAISCVSIAAQLATGPLSVLYFHQFPTYFLVSNLFIIPAAFISLLGSLLMMLLSLIPIAARGVGWLLNEFVSLVNRLVFWVSQFPESTINGIHLDILQTWLMYFVIGGIVSYLVYQKKYWLTMAFCVSVAFAVSQIFHFSEAANSIELTQLDLNNMQVVDARVGFESVLAADSAFLIDIEKQSGFISIKREFYQGSNYVIDEDELEIPTVDSKLGKVQIIDGNSVLFLKQLIEIDKRVSFDLIFIDGRDFKFNQEYLDKIQANEFVVGSNLWKRTEEQLIDYLGVKWALISFYQNRRLF